MKNNKGKLFLAFFVLVVVFILSTSFAIYNILSNQDKIVGHTVLNSKASSDYVSNQSLCGNGILDSGELCDYAANDSANNPYGSQCTSSCTVNGAPPVWKGCRGNGISVCTDAPGVTGQYFLDHPNCVPNHECSGQFYTCNGVICPPPTSS